MRANAAVEASRRRSHHSLKKAATRAAAPGPSFMNLEQRLLPAWRSPASLPVNPQTDWTLWSGRRMKATGFAACQKAAGNWDPLGGALIGHPGFERLRPLAEVAEFAGIAVQRYDSRLAFAAWVYGLSSAGLFAFALSRPQISGLFPVAFMVAILFAVVIAERVVHQIDPRAIVDRSRFIAWLKLSRTVRIAALAFGAGMLASWILQLAVDDLTHDDEGALKAYGVVFGNVRAGEWWRLLSGPYIHSGVVHMASNLGIGLLGISIAAPMWDGLWAASAFMIGNVAAAATETAWASHAGMAGVSGGVFAVFGMIIAIALFRPAELPRGGAIPLAGVLLISLPVAAMQGAHVAMLAHASGFLLGVLFGAIKVMRLRRADRQAVP
jgi:membrane associated rhomboid family serine protease